MGDLRPQYVIDPEEAQMNDSPGPYSNEDCVFASAAKCMKALGYGDPLEPEQWRAYINAKHNTPNYGGPEYLSYAIEVIQDHPGLFPNPPAITVENPGDVVGAVKGWLDQGFPVEPAFWCDCATVTIQPGPQNCGHASCAVASDAGGILVENVWRGTGVYLANQTFAASYSGGVLVFHRSVKPTPATQPEDEDMGIGIGKRNDDATVDIAVRGTDGACWLQVRQPGDVPYGWRSIYGQIAGAPSLTNLEADRYLLVEAKAPDGRIWEYVIDRQTGGDGPWKLQAGGGLVGGGGFDMNAVPKSGATSPFEAPQAGPAPVTVVPTAPEPQTPSAAVQEATTLLAPVLPKGTPWYLNPVVWTTYLTMFAGVFFALSPLLVSYPGAPTWLISAIGLTGTVLGLLGYQKHSATVRAAELAAPPTG